MAGFFVVIKAVAMLFLAAGLIAGYKAPISVKAISTSA
jgi:hypothetical protein